jgi:hypothetical protein
MFIEDVFTYNRKQLEYFFPKDQLRKEDTVKDLRYFLVTDAYENNEFPSYQRELLSLCNLKLIKVKDSFYKIMMESNINLTLKQVFAFSTPFMKFLLNAKYNDEKKLRCQLAKCLFNDNIINEETYFNSPCYEVNMLYSTSYEDMVDIFFSYTFHLNSADIIISRVIERLSYKKYKREERDLNVYLFIKYYDKINNILGYKNDKYIDTQIISVISINIEHRRAILSFLFEESKNSDKFGIIRSMGKSINDYPNCLIFLQRLEKFTPYTVSGEDLSHLYKLNNFLSDDMLSKFFIPVQNYYYLNTELISSAWSLNKEDFLRRINNYSIYHDILGQTSTGFVFRFLSRVDNLQQYLIPFKVTMNIQEIHFTFKNDLIVICLFSFFLLEPEDWDYFISNYRFELFDIQFKDYIYNYYTLDKKFYAMTFPLFMTKMALMSQHFDFVNYDYAYTHIYIANNLLSGGKIDYPAYISEIIDEEKIKNQYKQGIDIHDNDRDNKTLEGVKLLFSSQGKLNNINELFSHFIDYAKDKLNDEDKLTFSRVLGFNIITGEKIQRQNVTDWEGMLDKGILLNDEIFDSKELIARFFLFAETYEDVKDRENLKHGTLKGILNSLQIDTEEEQEMNLLYYGKTSESHIVCNPGKIQRLVASTISGRLKGVDGKIFNLEDKTVRKIDKRIKNFNQIHEYLQPFINLHMSEKNMRVDSTEKFFTLLYDYVWHLSKGDVLNFGVVVLDMSYVVYYCIFLAMKGDVLHIDSEMSLTSNFPCMFDVKYYTDMFGKREQEAWELLYGKGKEKEKKEIRDSKSTLTKIEDVRRNQQIRQELHTTYCRSPTREEILQERKKRGL